MGKWVATKKHTVSLDPQLALGYLVSAGMYVYTVVREGNDVTDFELVLIVVEHEVPQSDIMLAWVVYQQWKMGDMP
jgi:hypothetical protein